MAISERDRLVLHQSLDELMDPDVADTLMRHLPPGGWANMATKHDLTELEDRLTNRFETLLTREIGGLRSEMHSEFSGLPGQMQSEFSGLRSEMHSKFSGLRSEMDSEIGGLRSEMRSEIGGLRSEIGGLRSEMHSELHAMARTYLLGNIALVFAVAAIAFGAARLV